MTTFILKDGILFFPKECENVICYKLEGRDVCFEHNGRRVAYAGIYPRVWYLKDIAVKYKRYSIDVDMYDISLRPYQRKAYQNWLFNHKVGIIVLPTGAGKTFIALKAMHDLKTTTLVLVPTRQLLYQWRNRINKYLGVDVSIWGDGKKEVSAITISTYASASKLIEKYDIFSLIIADEVHHVPSNTLIRALLHCSAPFRLGLTATLKRSDKREPVSYHLIGPIVYRATFKDLKEYFPDLEYKKVNVKIPDELRDKITRLDTRQQEKVVSMLPHKIYAVANLLRDPNINKAIVFTKYVDSARKIASAIYNTTDRNVALIYGRTPRATRQFILSQFANGNIDTLVTTTILDEGLDVSDVDTIIIASPSKSARQLVQRVGRSMRKGKEKATIYDVVIKGTIDEKRFNERKKVVLWQFSD